MHPASNKPPEADATGLENSPHGRALMLLARNHRISAGAIDSLRRGSRRGNKLWVTPSYIANAAGCAVSTARRARDRIAKLIGLKFDLKGWTVLSRWHIDLIDDVCDAMDAEGLTPELPEGLAADRRLVPEPSGTTIACPFHRDTHPSAWCTWDAVASHGGARCLASGCGCRFALRRDTGSGAVLAIRSRGDAADMEELGTVGGFAIRRAGMGRDGGYSAALTREGRGISRTTRASPSAEPHDARRGGGEGGGRPRVTPDRENTRADQRPILRPPDPTLYYHVRMTLKVDGHGRPSKRSLRIAGPAPETQERWHARNAGTDYIAELVPNYIGPSEFISVSRGIVDAWSERTIRGNDPRSFWVPTSFGGRTTRRIPFDIDNHDEQAGPVQPEILDRLEAALPESCGITVVRTSPTGSWVLVELPDDVHWDDIGSDMLEDMGSRVHAALGWGGRLDRAVWHPEAMVRLPGWRTIYKGPLAGSGWLVRWYRSKLSQQREETLRAHRAPRIRGAGRTRANLPGHGRYPNPEAT